MSFGVGVASKFSIGNPYESTNGVSLSQVLMTVRTLVLEHEPLIVASLLKAVAALVEERRYTISLGAWAAAVDSAAIKSMSASPCLASMLRVLETEKLSRCSAMLPSTSVGVPTGGLSASSHTAQMDQIRGARRLQSGSMQTPMVPRMGPGGSEGHIHRMPSAGSSSDPAIQGGVGHRPKCTNAADMRNMRVDESTTPEVRNTFDDEPASDTVPGATRIPEMRNTFDSEPARNTFDSERP
eukprot:TRINITY_DN81489_c0_g1_i1.p1 TRINITY_DN81489_c0_g1~~TRINITY_DN81489_c0_g1_i1.p1  ORF type:complete len:240 (+),score=27.36 TRINITY_DN81489_c0_g1_i1:91-810(+)